MLLTGTIRKSDNPDEIDHIGAEGADYDSARALLSQRIPEGFTMIAIRTDQ